MTSFVVPLDIPFVGNCCWKTTKQLGLTFLSLLTADIPPGDFAVNFWNLVKVKDSVYSFWVELDTKTGTVMWGLLILSLLCPVLAFLQPSLLEKMAGRYKETCESVFVAEHLLICSRGRLSMIWMALSVLSVRKQRSLRCIDVTSCKFFWIILGLVSIRRSPGHTMSPSLLGHSMKLEDTLK